MPEAIQSAKMLKELRTERQDSFAKFAATLSAITKRRISKPYFIAMEQGKRPITVEVERALWVLAAIHDKADPDIYNARQVVIRTTRQISAGAIITVDSKRCARPGCQECFVPSNPAQRYHSPYCRSQYKSERNSK